MEVKPNVRDINELTLNMNSPFAKKIYQTKKLKDLLVKQKQIIKESKINDKSENSTPKKIMHHVQPQIIPNTTSIQFNKLVPFTIQGENGLEVQFKSDYNVQRLPFIT